MPGDEARGPQDDPGIGEAQGEGHEQEVRHAQPEDLAEGHRAGEADRSESQRSGDVADQRRLVAADQKLIGDQRGQIPADYRGLGLPGQFGLAERIAPSGHPENGENDEDRRYGDKRRAEPGQREAAVEAADVQLRPEIAVA